MPMLVTLDVPSKHPRWATDPSRTTEPDESGPNVPNKDEGWINNYKPPARKQNWLDNLHYKWGQKLSSLVLSNFYPNTIIAAPNNDIDSIIFHPLYGKFLLVARSNDGFFSSADGHTWSTPASFSSTKLCTAIDNSRYITGDLDGSLYYTSGGSMSSWVQVSAATIGGSGSIQQIHTKYPDSNFAIITKGSGLRIAASGVNVASWVAPTVGPTMSTTFNSLLYAGGSTWFLSNGSTPATPTLYISTDDGDNWSQVTTQPFTSSSDSNGGIAHSRDTNRLVAIGNISPSTEERIKYSDDNGATWTDATIDKIGLDAIATLTKVYYCGGDMWVACGGNIDGDTGEKSLYVSYDNAETWRIPDINKTAVGTSASSFRAIACSKRNIMIAGDDGLNILSQSVV